MHGIMIIWHFSVHKLITMNWVLYPLICTISTYILWLHQQILPVVDLFEIKKNVTSQSSSNLDPLLQQDLPVPLKIVSENLTTIIANAKENKVCEFCIIQANATVVVQVYKGSIILCIYTMYIMLLLLPIDACLLVTIKDKKWYFGIFSYMYV